MTGPLLGTNLRLHTTEAVPILPSFSSFFTSLLLVKSIWLSLPSLAKPLSSFHLAPASNLPSDTVQTCCRLSGTHLTSPGAQEPLLVTHHLLWLKQGSRPPVNSGKPISRAVPKPWASLRQLGLNRTGMMARAGLPLCCMGSKGWKESLSVFTSGPTHS